MTTVFHNSNYLNNDSTTVLSDIPLISLTLVLVKLIEFGKQFFHIV